MGCCSSSSLLALTGWFERGAGKWILIILLFLSTCFAVFMLISLLPSKGYLPDTLIEYKLRRDFCFGKNPADYHGYIRFDTDTRGYAGNNTDGIHVAKIVLLSLPKDRSFTHGVRIELLDDNRSLVSELLLPVEKFYLSGNRSYNIIRLSDSLNTDKIKYFRYGLSDNPSGK